MQLVKPVPNESLRILSHIFPGRADSDAKIGARSNGGRCDLLSATDQGMNKITIRI